MAFWPMLSLKKMILPHQFESLTEPDANVSEKLHCTLLKCIATIHVLYINRTHIHIWYDSTHMVWLSVPYVYSYYTITVYKQHIAIANTVLLFILDQYLYPQCSFLQ